MQQLLKLKKENEPQEPLVSTDSLSGLDPLNESSGQFSELRDLLSTLFTSSFLLELKEETKSLDIILDEEEKKLTLKLKKKTRSKSLAKKGQVYALRKEWKMSTLTLVYNYQQNYEPLSELQHIRPIEPMVDVIKPVEVSQPKTMVLDTPKLPVKPPILIKTPEDLSIILPLPEYTEDLLQKLPNKTYEEQFKPSTIKDTYLEVDTELNTDNYLYVPEEPVLPEIAEQYKPELAVQTPTQNFEGQLGGVQVLKYDKPKLENGEFIYREIKMRDTGLTTVYDLLRNSGLPFKEVYSKEFNGKYIEALDEIPEGETYWEAKINGQYITSTVDKAIVKPGDEVTWVLKTARPGVCGQPIAG